MPCTLNKKAWEKLIDEDIDWLDKQPDTLECKHIRQILEWVKKHKPDKQVERIEELEKRLKTWHSPENLQTACRVRDERIKELEAENKQLLELSENLNEHPEGYNGPCLCQLCKSYG